MWKSTTILTHRNETAARLQTYPTLLSSFKPHAGLSRSLIGPRTVLIQVTNDDLTMRYERLIFQVRAARITAEHLQYFQSRRELFDEIEPIKSGRLGLVLVRSLSKSRYYLDS